MLRMALEMTLHFTKYLGISAVFQVRIPKLPLGYRLNTHPQPFNGPLSVTTRVGRYQKKHSPIHSHPGRLISSLFNLCAWQSRSFGLPLGLEPSTPYSIHFFTQSSFSNTCNNNLFCCSTEIMSSISNLNTLQTSGQNNSNNMFSC